MPSRLEIPIGQRYGRLTVLTEESPHRCRGGQLVRRFRCKCDCGTERTVRLAELRSGRTESCGCLNRERNTRHGRHLSRVYRIWASMKIRCMNPKHRSYKNYGGRGISVSDDWQDFANFYRDMGDPAPGMTLDRIDNSKGYSKENCRWATMTQQASNRRTNRLVNYGGEVKTITQWADALGINRSTFWYMLDAKAFKLDGQRMRAAEKDGMIVIEPADAAAPQEPSKAT